MLNRLSLEAAIYQTLQRAPSSKDAATKIANTYVDYARLATVTPIIVPPKAKALAYTLNFGFNTKTLGGFLSALNTGLATLWPGTPVTGGAVVTYAGTPFILKLSSKLKNGITSRTAAAQIAAALDAATRAVFYVIPPSGPAPLS